MLQPTFSSKFLFKSLFILTLLIITIPTLAQDSFQPAGEGSFIPEGYTLVGDMYVRDPDQDAEGTASVYLNGGIWPTNGIIPYEFDTTTLPVDATQQAAAEYAMNELEALIGVDFVPLSSLPGWTDGYLTFYYDPNLAAGGNAILGYNGAVSHFVIIRVWNVATLLHELGHALGLFHEQQRSDRDNYVFVDYSKITPGREGAFDIATGQPVIGEYDFASVMHYGSHSDSINGDPTIIALPAYTQWQERMNTYSFTEGDLLTLRTLYPCSLQGCAGNPVNDNFNNRLTINSLPFTHTPNARLSTLAWDDPFPSCAYAGGNHTDDTVWYQFTPASTLDVQLETEGSNYDTVISVWTGTRQNLVEVGCDNDTLQGYIAKLDITLNGGTTYYIMVSRNGSQDTDANLVFHAEVDLFLPPPNDNQINATNISSVPFSDVQDLDDASLESPEPDPVYCGTGLVPEKTVWYRFIPTESQDYHLRTTGSTFTHSFVALYNSSLDAIYCVWSGGYVDTIAQMWAGTEYWIQVGAYDGNFGDLKFTLAPVISNPPANTNLIYNPSFNNGQAGWKFYGSIQHTVTNNVMNLRFASSVDGWMRQFRAANPLPGGIPMEASVDIQNPSGDAKTFRLQLADSDLTNVYSCLFTVPPYAPLQRYRMRFVTNVDWYMIRVDMRPQVVGKGGLNVDNVNLRYQPSLTITTKECIEAPDLPPQNSNLIYNPGFDIGANDDAGWRYEGNINGSVIANVMKLNFPSTVNGWLRQYRGVNPLVSGLRMVAWVTVSNPDPTPKTFQFMVRDSDLSNTYLCSFNVPANSPNKNYYLRFITLTNWEIIEVDLRPNVVDTNGLKFDNVNLQYRPWLTFTANQECIAPALDEAPTPPTSELVLTDVP